VRFVVLCVEWLRRSTFATVLREMKHDDIETNKSRRRSQQHAPFATELPEVKHEGRITTVCLSSKTDERYIVCGSEDAKLSVFDRQLTHRQSLLVGHVDKVSACLAGSFD